jgi:hypothetical protein
METRIDLRVRLHGQERLLRLVSDDGEWHAALLIPGRRDPLTGECLAPSSPGVWLPRILVDGFDLLIERAARDAEGNEIWFTRTPGYGSATNGWLALALRSFRADCHEGIGYRPKPVVSLSLAHDTDGRR